MNRTVEWSKTMDTVFKLTKGDKKKEWLEKIEELKAKLITEYKIDGKVTVVKIDMLGMRDLPKTLQDLLIPKGRVMTETYHELLMDVTVDEAKLLKRKKAATARVMAVLENIDLQAIADIAAIRPDLLRELRAQLSDAEGIIDRAEIEEEE